VALIIDISAPYKAPENPELTVETSLLPLVAWGQQVVGEMTRRGLLQGHGAGVR
jgi:adenylylsulfate kinase-like enzyme